MLQATALVRPSSQAEFDRRVAERQTTHLEALTRPLDTATSIGWGAAIQDVSSSGLGLSICYPFHAGTYLAVDIQGTHGVARSYLTRVIHAHDQSDGTWHVGCEFVKPLSDSELEMIV